MAQEGHFVEFRGGGSAGPHLLLLPHPSTTDFAGDVTKLEFHLDHRLLRDPTQIPRRPPGDRRHRIARQQAEAPLPDFPAMSEIPMHDHGDFERVMFDALLAIWARVSRCQAGRASGLVFLQQQDHLVSVHHSPMIPARH